MFSMALGKSVAKMMEVVHYYFCDFSTYPIFMKIKNRQTYFQVFWKLSL